MPGPDGPLQPMQQEGTLRKSMQVPPASAQKVARGSVRSGSGKAHRATLSPYPPSPRAHHSPPGTILQGPRRHEAIATAAILWCGNHEAITGTVILRGGQHEAPAAILRDGGHVSAKGTAILCSAPTWYLFGGGPQPVSARVTRAVHGAD